MYVLNILNSSYICNKQYLNNLLKKKSNKSLKKVNYA